MSEPMSPPPPPYTPPPPAGPGAAQQVQGPAIGLIVTAVIGLLLGLLNLLSTLVGFSMPYSDMGDMGPGAEYMRYMTGVGWGRSSRSYRSWFRPSSSGPRSR